MLSLFTLSPNRRKQSRSSRGRQGEAGYGGGGGGGGGGNSSDEKCSLSRSSSQAASSNSSKSDQALLLSRKTRGMHTTPATPSPPRRRPTNRSNPTVLPLSPPGSDRKNRSTLRVEPPDLDEELKLDWRFANTSIPLVDTNRNSVKWGLLSERDDVILGLEDLGILVQAVCAELSKRGLETPLLFSSLAVNLSSRKINSLIRTYVASVQSAFDWTTSRPTSQEDAWTQEILLSGERELAWVLRWALSRVLQIRERNEEKRGLVDLDQYAEWRKSERAADYPQTHIFAFAAKLGTLVQPIFIDLLTLFSKLVAHSHLSGCTPPVVAGLFGPLLFGLPVTSTFVDTHKNFTKSALATEHLLLSFIRSQSFASLQKNLPLPLRLESWAKNYPAMVVSDRVWLSGEPRMDGKSVRSELIQRDVREYSTELFRAADSWVGELENVSDGNGVCDVWMTEVMVRSRNKAGAIVSTKGPRFASDYKKRLNIQSTALPSYRAMSHGSLCMLAAGEADENEWDEDEEGTGWETLAEKKWGVFAQDGFDFIGESTERSFGQSEPGDRIDGKLQFDLTESSRAAKRAEKRVSITWNDFSNTGFPDTGIMLSDPLDLSLPIQKEITNWPEHREQVYQRLKNSQKNLPKFEYHVQPRLCEPVTIEEAFVDAWADLLLSAGWTKRVDPTARECNWAIVQYKVIDRKEGPTKPDTLFAVFEEFVPTEYQRLLATPPLPPKKQTGFHMFTSKRSKQKRPNGKDPVQSHRDRDRDEGFDSTVWRDRSARQLLVFQRSQSTNLDDRKRTIRSVSSATISLSGSSSESGPGLRPRVVHGSRSEPSLVNIRKGFVKAYEGIVESPGKGEGERECEVVPREMSVAAMTMTREALVRDRMDRSMDAPKEQDKDVDPNRRPIGSDEADGEPDLYAYAHAHRPAELSESGPELGPACWPTPVGRSTTTESGENVPVIPDVRSTETARSASGPVERGILRAAESRREDEYRRDRMRADIRPLRIFPRPDVRTESEEDTSDDQDRTRNRLTPLGAPLSVCSPTGSASGRSQSVVLTERPALGDVIQVAIPTGGSVCSGEAGAHLTRPREGRPPLDERQTARSRLDREEQSVRVSRDDFVPVSSYVHGQPLHNLLEEEEEEEEER